MPFDIRVRTHATLNIPMFRSCPVHSNISFVLPLRYARAFVLHCMKFALPNSCRQAPCLVLSNFGAHRLLLYFEVFKDIGICERLGFGF